MCIAKSLSTKQLAGGITWVAVMNEVRQGRVRVQRITTSADFPVPTHLERV
jgi:hypothetical protein